MLVDAARIADMAAFDTSPLPYRLSFYDILLVTAGRGHFALDDEQHEVKPGVVFFTRPGEVRRWQVNGLDGACLFFAGEFLTEAFADTRLIDQFDYWRPGRPSGALRLEPAQRRAFLERFERMRREFATLRGDAGHLLRAGLYELLVLLNRWYVVRHGETPARHPHPKVERFQALIERHHASRHRVADYAGLLHLTPGHLSALCRRHLGCPAGQVIHDRIALEARRLLRHTDLPAASVGYRLGFADPAYFSRFLRRETGLSPTDLRHGR